MNWHTGIAKKRGGYLDAVQYALVIGISTDFKGICTGETKRMKKVITMIILLFTLGVGS